MDGYTRLQLLNLIRTNKRETKACNPYSKMLKADLYRHARRLGLVDGIQEEKKQVQPARFESNRFEAQARFVKLRKMLQIKYEWIMKNGSDTSKKKIQNIVDQADRTGSRMAQMSKDEQNAFLFDFENILKKIDKKLW
jgi:molecular chaperone GrpE (heat shock protein)